MILSWHSFDLKTGRRICPLTVRDESFPTLERVIGEVTNATVDVLCWDESEQAPVPGWDAATLAGRTMLVALDEFETPVWGGKVDRRRSNEGPWVSCDLSTLESYFDRRFVRDHTYTGTAQDAIVSDVVTSDVLPNGVQFVLDVNSATQRDRLFEDQQDTTVLTMLNELASDTGGMDWTVDLAWHDDTKTVLDRVLRVRTSLGQQSNAVFQMPGSVTTFTHIEDFTADFGANDVMAYSSGEGDLRPESSHHVAQDHLDAGWVTYERRDQPAASLLDIEALDAYAAEELTRMQDGAVQLSIEAALSEAPRFGSDFHLGDSVLVSLTTNGRFPEQVGPDGDRVAGFSSWQRVSGVTIDVKGNRIIPRFLGGAE